MASHYTWGSVTALHDFGGVLGRLVDTFFGISQFHGHDSWLVCEVALSKLAFGLSQIQTLGNILDAANAMDNPKSWQFPSICIVNLQDFNF
jgi:hypothetical protein